MSAQTAAASYSSNANNAVQPPMVNRIIPKAMTACTYPHRPFRTLIGEQTGSTNTEAEIETVLIRVIGIVVRYRQIGEYINALPAALEANKADRMIVAGDFNLPVPDGPLSQKLVSVLEAAGLRVVTRGDHRVLEGERKLRDHIAISNSLECSNLQVWPRRDAESAETV